jgi:AcrR family transcriptional regulator
MSGSDSKSSNLPAKARKSERTRGAILQAARELFADLGYARTTVRDIAARAAIDPAMVMRYFGSKDALFARATAIDLKLPDLTKIRPAQLGDTLIRHFLELWEGPASSGTLTILLRTSASDEDAAARMREVFAGQVLPMLARIADPAQVPTRAGLIATQLLGLALCRYVLKVPPVVAMTPERIVACFGPLLQQHITGEPC